MNIPRNYDWSTRKTVPKISARKAHPKAAANKNDAGGLPKSSKVSSAIATTLLSRGAVAVLGSMIPIDVRRNETLLHRFFSIIAECIEGKFGLTTLSDAWRAAQTSNVVADIVQGSPLLESWASLEWMNLADRMTEWEIDGRFTNQNLYRDAEAMLAVSAKDHGLEQQYNEHLQRSYVPETLFYLMTGRPDRIVLKDDFSLKSRQQRRRLDELGRVNDRA